MFGQGASPFLLRLRDLFEKTEGCGCGTDASLARTFVRQQVFGVGPAHVLLADEILHRNANVREEHLVDLMLTFERYNRSHLHARRLHVDQEEGDARLLLALCRCTHQAEDHVGILGECGPGLLTIVQIMRSEEHTSELQSLMRISYAV